MWGTNNSFMSVEDVARRTKLRADLLRDVEVAVAPNSTTVLTTESYVNVNPHFIQNWDFKL